jgi:hypothetical protein
VYYRVDILKALIADHLFSAPEQYTVVTDGDVTPMDRRELFDKRTLQYLDESGYVFNRVGYSNFENSFFIFHKNEKLREIHRKTVIHEVEKRITSVRSEPQGTVFYTQYCLGSQEVWDRYLDFRTKILEDVDKGSVRVPRKVVQCPSSSFGLGSIHSDKDHQNKTWRFIGDSHVPYTRNGRSGGSEERQIAHLVDWQEEILSDVR